MDKNILYAIVYSPIFFLIIYLVFFNKLESSKKNIIEKKEETNLKINNNYMNNNIKQISLNDFKEEIKSEDTILVDIRTPMEWQRY
jgi:predicted sulfurtransferase